MSGHQHSFVLLLLVIHKMCPAVALSPLNNPEIPALPALNIFMHRATPGITHLFSHLLNYVILLGLIEKGFYKEYFEKKIINSCQLEIC